MNPDAEVVFSKMDTGTDREAADEICRMIETGQFTKDIVRMNTYIYRDVAQKLNDWEWGRKHLHDFLEEPDFIELYRPKLVEWTKDRGRCGGIWPGPYLETKYACIWFNAELGEKVGFVPEGMQLSMEDLLSAAQKLHEYNRIAEKKIGLFGLCNANRSTYRILRRLFTSGLVDEDGNLLPPDEAPCRESLRETLRYFEKLAAFDAFFLCPDKRDDIELFMNEEVLFLPSYTERYFSMLDRNGAEWLEHIQLLESPQLKPTNFAFGEFEHSWAVMENGPNRDLGAAFLKHIAKSQMQAESMEGAKLQSGLRGSFFAELQTKSHFNTYISYMIEKYQDNMHEAYVESARYWPTSNPPYNSPFIKELLYGILLDGLSADEAYGKIIR